MNYVCPKCKKPLLRKDDGYSCEGCRKEYPVSEGILTFCEADYYWGEIAQEEFNTLLAKSREGYWKDVLAELFGETKPEYVAYVTGENRVPWKHLLNLNSIRGTVLDIGAGAGAIAFSLADIFDEVYAMEYIRERVEFISLRARQDGLKKVKCVQASVFELPFKEHSMDVIVCNGILEWVGEWNPYASPFRVQQDVLSRLKTLLKPGGLLIIGIENRFGYSFFLGREDHNNLKYTSFLPRGVSNLISLIKNKKSYRTHTYSLKGYKKLLRAAGFSQPEFFYVSPGYNVINTMFPLEPVCFEKHLEAYHRNQNYTTHLKIFLGRMGARLGLLKYFSPDYIIFARSDV